MERLETDSSHSEFKRVADPDAATRRSYLLIASLYQVVFCYDQPTADPTGTERRQRLNVGRP